MRMQAVMIAIALTAGTGVCEEATQAVSPRQEGAMGQDLAYVNRVVQQYASQKYRQMNTAASNEVFRVHDYFHRLFAGMTTGDATAVSNAYAWIRPRIGQYQRCPRDPEPDPDLNNPAWQYVLDAHGTWGEVSHWTPRMLRGYANDILDSIPGNAVLFA